MYRLNEENIISRFRYNYYFLSNFYPAIVYFDGRVYENNEAAFQSMKSMDPSIRDSFKFLEPNIAKARGRHIKLRLDWEEVKDEIMYEIVKAKFTQPQNVGLKNQLLETGDAHLIEGNDWGDNYWGICYYDNLNDENENNNHLGKILMRVREEIQKEIKEKNK